MGVTATSSIWAVHLAASTGAAKQHIHRRYACRTQAEQKQYTNRRYTTSSTRAVPTSSVIARKRNCRSCAFGSMIAGTAAVPAVPPAAAAFPLPATTTACIAAAAALTAAAVVLRSSGWWVGSLLQGREQRRRLVRRRRGVMSSWDKRLAGLPASQQQHKALSQQEQLSSNPRTKPA